MKATILKVSESKKSALLGLGKSEFHFGSSKLVYVPNRDYTKGQVIDIPDDLKTEVWLDKEGKERKTKTGVPLLVFAP